jgi:formylglycine-generating enzyme required for sulfatase activity
MPNKLFISYPSESWNFAQRLANDLAQHLDDSIFIDYRSIDQPDFEIAILSHLKSSQGVLLVVTDKTFEDIHRDTDWVRLEIRTALENNIPIVLVRENGLLPPTDLPADVRDVTRSQGVPFYREFFEPGIILLKDTLLKFRLGTPKTGQHIERPEQVIAVTPPPAAAPAVPEPPQKPLTLNDASRLVAQGDYEQAKFILENLLTNGTLRMTMRPAAESLLADCEAHLQARTRRQEAEADYQDILEMAEQPATQNAARKAWIEWLKTYPDLAEQLDTADLRSRFAPPKPRIVGERSAVYLPQPFAWITIPAGKVTLITEEGWEDNYVPKGQPLVVQVPSFAIAKYPLTNAQYKLFVDAGGYKERRWWTDAGWEKRENEKWTQPRYWDDSQWNAAEQPVVGVSWYEAIAYCQWLSEQTSDSILLPSETQWQRAAQGDDGREYPWGNDWQEGKLCNNNVGSNNSSVTSPVRRYEGQGDSPFGVVDMAGNVWEWCRTAYDTGSEDQNGTNVRVLRGGSWISSNSVRFRCAYRGRDNPHGRFDSGGFRLALSG